MSRFIFRNYAFDHDSLTAQFNYTSSQGFDFTETVAFAPSDYSYDPILLKRALFLAFMVIGTSYYKAFPTTEFELDHPIDAWQANFFNLVYQEGLGQFAFENNLTRQDLINFQANSWGSDEGEIAFDGKGILALQSGGKDSLLLAELLLTKGQDFMPWYVSSTQFYPSVLDKLGQEPKLAIRQIDRESLQKASLQGAKNGHVPVTYIIQSLAVVQAILSGRNQILSSIGHEGEEVHARIGGLEVTHQWSKTWLAEQEFSRYVQKYISPDIMIGSPLRSYSELRIAELFVEHCWKKYKQDFSSCNMANYKQGADNRQLSWCANCPKCANAFLLFAPFVKASDLVELFGGQNLFLKPELTNTFKGLLGIDGVLKPFECIGEVNELRLAYQLSIQNGYDSLPFNVPESRYDYLQKYPMQKWAEGLLC